MEVALKILGIDGLSNISHCELMVNDFNYKFHSEITYKIHTIHDFLFGQAKILIMSNGFLFTNLRGFCVIRNISLIPKKDNIGSLINHGVRDNDSQNDHNFYLTLPILEASFLYKTEYYTDSSAHHKGKVRLSFTIKYVEEDSESSMAKNSFVHKAIDLLLVPKKSSLIKNLKNIIDEAAKGSPKEKMNILLGVFLMDKFLSNLNHKLTYGIEFNDLLNLNICVVEKKLFPNGYYDSEVLEGVLLRSKYKYNLQSISEFVDSNHLKDKFKIIKVERPNAIRGEVPITNENNTKDNSTKDKINYSFSTFVRFIFNQEDKNIKEDLSKSELEILNEDSTDQFNDESTPIDWDYKSIHSHEEIKTNWIRKLEIKEEFKRDICTQYENKNDNTVEDSELINQNTLLNPIALLNTSSLLSLEDLLSNEGFVCAHKIFINELLNVFYFAIGSYGNTWPTTFLQRRRKIKPEKVPDPHRRAILETLNIQDDLLLVTLFGDSDIPDFIIFFDRIVKRLVLSFKGTSTSNETLHDLDCEYTSFYEGLTHKGIKRLAVAFIESEIGKIIALLKMYNTNELLITGHSLGGSLASIITIIIRKEGLLKDVKITTIAFSSAPIVSFNLTDQPIFTVNYGNDVIPRLCYGSVCEMRYVCCSLGTLKNGINLLEDIRKHLNQTQLFPKLYHPGKVYQLRRIKTVRKGKIISLLFYKTVGLEYYENLLIVKHSLKHHMINHISKVLKECSKDFNELEKRR